MKTRNISVSQLESALEKINQPDMYNGNIKGDITEKFTTAGAPRHSIKMISYPIQNSSL